MPSLLLFDRQTILGGDDLQPACFLTIAARLFQTTLLLFPVIHNMLVNENHCDLFQWRNTDCRKAHWYCLFLNLWILGTLLFSIASVTLEARIAHWSSIGPPTQVEPRSSKVRQLLEFKLLWFSSICLFVIWCMGIVAVSWAPSHFKCQQDDPDQPLYSFLEPFLQWWWLAGALLLISQLLEWIVSLIFCIQLFRTPVYVPGGTDETQQLRDDVIMPYQYDHEIVEEMWAERCHSCCNALSAVSCYMFGGRHFSGNPSNEFADVARALADFMESAEALDVVASDLVTGLIVLQRLQRQRIYASRREINSQSDRLIESSRVVEDDGNSVLTNGSGIRRRVQSTNKLTIADAEEGDSGFGRSGSQDHLLEATESSGRSSKLFGVTNHRDDFVRRDSCLLSREVVDDMALLEESARYAKYALAIYTWVLYLYVHPITGPARLLGRNRCKCLCKDTKRRRGATPESPTSLPSQGSAVSLMELSNGTGRIEGDNLCEVHKNAMLLTAGLDDADLVYVQLKSSFTENPYCILLDHEWKTVVVSVRGTFSLEDCVTDALIEPKDLSLLGREFGFDAEDEHCHRGVLTCTQNVYRDLERHGVLDSLLLGEGAQYPDYTLRLVGHSLGAATCTLLSYMLKQKFPTLRCVNYSPPGCSFTWDLATRCKEWCTSCVLDSDLVPRLSVNALLDLRNEVLGLIGRIKVPKIEVARRFVHTSGFWGCFTCQRPDPEDRESLMQSIQEILYEFDQVPDSEYQRQLTLFQEVQEERKRRRGAARSIKLYPPGRIIHLVKTGEKRTCVSGIAKCLTCWTTNHGAHYYPVWIENDTLDEIVVSPTMGVDHFPNRVQATVESVAKDFGIQLS